MSAATSILDYARPAAIQPVPAAWVAARIFLTRTTPPILRMAVFSILGFAFALATLATFAGRAVYAGWRIARRRA